MAMVGQDWSGVLRLLCPVHVVFVFVPHIIDALILASKLPYVGHDKDALHGIVDRNSHSRGVCLNHL